METLEELKQLHVEERTTEFMVRDKSIGFGHICKLTPTHMEWESEDGFIIRVLHRRVTVNARYGIATLTIE